MHPESLKARMAQSAFTVPAMVERTRLLTKSLVVLKLLKHEKHKAHDARTSGFHDANVMCWIWNVYQPGKMSRKVVYIVYMFSCNDELALESLVQSVSRFFWNFIGTLFVSFGPLESLQQSEVGCRIMEFHGFSTVSSTCRVDSRVVQMIQQKRWGNCRDGQEQRDLVNKWQRQ